jgi:hypothetical protein
VGIAHHYLIHTVIEVNVVYMMLIFPGGCFRQAMPALVRLKVRNARGVKVPFRENAFRPVIDRNCVIVR